MEWRSFCTGIMYNLFNHPLHSLTGRLKTLNCTPKVGHPPKKQQGVFEACHGVSFGGCTRLADMLPSKYEDNTLQIKEKSTKRTAPFFVLEVTARSAADILGIHPNSAALFYRKIRTVINYHLALAADEVFEGPVEPDESYFGGRRKGRRGRGAAGKVVIFGILKCNGRVYTVVVDNAKSETLLPVIKKKIMPDSIVYTDSLSSYD